MKTKMMYAVLMSLLSMMLFFGQKSYIHAKAYEEATAFLVSNMSAKQLAEAQLKEWAEVFSLGLYKNGEKKKLKKLTQEAKIHKNMSQKYVLYALLPLLAILMSYFFLSLRSFTFFGALGAWITLVFGLISPIMMVTIHKKVEYLGDVVLSFESKGIIGSVTKLLDNGDMVVAAVILLFSVLVPMVKTLSLLFVSFFMESGFAHGMVKFFKMIGKWSMVDVFVVATFLVYLTANKGDVSRAEVEVGLYFFLAYVIVSMLVSLSADKMLHRRKKQTIL